MSRKSGKNREVPGRRGGGGGTPPRNRARMVPRRSGRKSGKKVGRYAERYLGLVTTRQHEILKLIAQGYSNREIGDHLDISTRTVEVHRFNIMKILKVNNVAQLIRVSLEQNLLTRAFMTRDAGGQVAA